MKDVSELTRRVLQAMNVRGVGPVTVVRLLQNPCFGTKSLEDLLHETGRKEEESLSSEVNRAQDAAELQLDQARKKGARVLSILDDEYPELLRQTPDRPPLIFVMGLMPALGTKSIGVIGTREPTHHGLATAERIATAFGETGWSIVSGLALGCDAAAHRAALASGSHTVAVLAHGLQTTTPKQHTKLAEQIVESGGALITEYPFGVPPVGHQYVKRDRIQAGLAAGVVMIQSDELGGSLHASRAAIEYGRLLAVPMPTPRDISAGESKIRANLVLCGSNDFAKAKLLKCKTEHLHRIFVLSSKVDYAHLDNLLQQVGSQLSSAPPVKPQTASLF